MDMVKNLEALQGKMDELGSAFTEYRSAQDERVEQIEENGKASDELLEKMSKLEDQLSQTDAVKTFPKIELENAEVV